MRIYLYGALSVCFYHATCGFKVNLPSVIILTLIRLGFLRVVFSGGGGNGGVGEQCNLTPLYISGRNNPISI